MPDDLTRIADAVRVCTLCPLHGTRIHAVPGEGPATAPVMLVGEAPGRTEDETGRPFAGAAGRNLDAALEAARLPRTDLFVTSIVKCRPPKNRDPTTEEKAACRPHLLAQVALVRPRVIVALGRHGLSGLVPAPRSFASVRGTFVGAYEGIPVWASLHPAAVIYRARWRHAYLDDWRRFGAWFRSGAPSEAFVPGPREAAVPPEAGQGAKGP